MPRKELLKTHWVVRDARLDASMECTTAKHWAHLERAAGQNHTRIPERIS